MPAIAAPVLPAALNGLPTAAAVAVLCVASVVVVAGLLLARHRSTAIRALARGTAVLKRRLSSTML